MSGRHTGRKGARVDVDTANDASLHWDTAQSLFVATDGPQLRDDATQTPLGCAEHDCVAVRRIARAPEANASRIDDVETFEEGDGASPVRNLTPRIDFVARRAFARAEAAMVVQQQGESGFSASEWFERVSTFWILLGTALHASARDDQLGAQVLHDLGLLINCSGTQH